MRSSHHTLSFIVPFLNEASNLPRLLSALDQFARTAAQARNLEVDVIFVDDGSSDGGRDVITACVCTNLIRPKVRLVRLSRNFGKEIALSVGLKAAASDAVVLMDADLQHPVALVEQFLDGWLNDGYDVVYAYKQTNEDEATLRRLGRRLYYRMVNSNAGPEIPLNAGDFRLLSRRAYEALRELPERQRLMKGLYSWIGFKQKGIPFTPAERETGQSKFSTLKLVLLAVDGITAFTILPLRLATWTGLALAIASGGYGLWTIFEKLFFGIAVPGYPTLITIVAFVGAAQLIFLGIIGEYLGKVLLEVKGRPLAIVESDEQVVGEVRTLKSGTHDGLALRGQI